MILFWDDMEFNENSCCITFASVGLPLSVFKCPNVSTYISVAFVRMHEEERRCGPYIDLVLAISSVLKMSAAWLWFRKTPTTPVIHYTCRGNLIKFSFCSYFIRREKKLPTKEIAPWRISLFHMLKVDKLVNNFPSFTGTRTFTTVQAIVIFPEPDRRVSSSTYEEHRNRIWELCIAKSRKKPKHKIILKYPQQNIEMSYNIKIANKSTTKRR
jgi:hypothetical protein